MIKDITKDVEWGDNDGESLPILKCICGQEFDCWGDFTIINNLVLSAHRWCYENKVSIALSNKILKQYRYHANILDHYGNCIIKLNEIIDSYERIEKMRNDEHK